MSTEIEVNNCFVIRLFNCDEIVSTFTFCKYNCIVLIHVQP